ncbi:hypothetical protein H7K45_10485 [Mycobacterium yunnanensis]|uniref:DUF202 domain-containing protein n=1 Tax=Mycobacterium yunnanensis TaxID=368477 RepID=A0A9X3BTC0_9MYCO|nr:hypothetical protein [Mycobacterium yunnanensis]MCV7420965.1 hypothetical protein [Mycobacterium yunnanensis]
MTLPRQRTHLGWERTALGFIAVAILLGVRTGETMVRGHALLAVLAVVAAAYTCIARRRQLSGTDVAVAPARWQVGLTGGLTAALGAGCAVAIWW